MNLKSLVGMDFDVQSLAKKKLKEALGGDIEEVANKKLREIFPIIDEFDNLKQRTEKEVKDKAKALVDEWIPQDAQNKAKAKLDEILAMKDNYVNSIIPDELKQMTGLVDAGKLSGEADYTKLMEEGMETIDNAESFSTWESRAKNALESGEAQSEFESSADTMLNNFDISAMMEEGNTEERMEAFADKVKLMIEEV